MKKADNFNAGKWLVENKLTAQSRLNEVETPLDTNNQNLKDKYIDAYVSLIANPEAGENYMDFPTYGDIERHAKQYGYEDTLRTIDKMGSVQPTQRNYGGEDKLASKTAGLSMRDPMQYITKKGKMNKLDVDRLKAKIKNNLDLDVYRPEDQDY